MVRNVLHSGRRRSLAKQLSVGRGGLMSGGVGLEQGGEFLKHIRNQVNQLLYLLCRNLLVLPEGLVAVEREQLLRLIQASLQLMTDTYEGFSPSSFSDVEIKQINSLKSCLHYLIDIKERFFAFRPYLVGDVFGFFVDWTAGELNLFILQGITPETPEITLSIQNLLETESFSFAQCEDHQLWASLCVLLEKKQQYQLNIQPINQLNILSYVKCYLQYAALEYVLSSNRQDEEALKQVFNDQDVVLSNLNHARDHICPEMIFSESEFFKILHEILLRQQQADSSPFVTPAMLWKAFILMRNRLSNMYDNRQIVEIGRSPKEGNRETWLDKLKSIFFSQATRQSFFVFFPVFWKMGGYIERLFYTSGLRAEDFLELQEKDLPNLSLNNGGAAIRWFIACNSNALNPLDYDLNKLSKVSGLYVWRFLFQTILLISVSFPLLGIMEMIYFPLKNLALLAQKPSMQIWPHRFFLAPLGYVAEKSLIFSKKIASGIYWGVEKLNHLLEIPAWMMYQFSKIVFYPFRGLVFKILKNALENDLLLKVAEESDVPQERSLSEYYIQYLKRQVRDYTLVLISRTRRTKAKQFFIESLQKLQISSSTEVPLNGEQYALLKRSILDEAEAGRLRVDVYVGIVNELYNHLEWEYDHEDDPLLSLFDGVCCLQRSLAKCFLSDLTPQQSSTPTPTPSPFLSPLSSPPLERHPHVSVRFENEELIHSAGESEIERTELNEGNMASLSLRLSASQLMLVESLESHSASRASPALIMGELFNQQPEQKFSWMVGSRASPVNRAY